MEDEEGPLESMKDYMLETIKRTFKVSPEQANQLYSELLQCVKKKHLVSFFLITFTEKKLYIFFYFSIPLKRSQYSG